MMQYKKWIFFFWGWVGMILYFTQRWLIGPLIPELMSEFHLSKTALGVIGSASIWGYMFTPILAGLLSDRFGRKYLILGGIFGFSGLTVLCSLTTTTCQLFAARFLTGTTEAFFFLTLLAYTLDLFPERPGFYLTLMASGSSLGWFTGPALAGWLLEATGIWRVPFLVTGLVGLIVTAMLFVFWPGEKKSNSAKPFLDPTIFRSANLSLLALLSLVAAFQISTEFGFTMWYPAFLELELRMTTASAGIIAGLYGLGQFVGRPILGWVSDRLGYRLVGIACGALMGFSLMLVLDVKSLALRALFTFETGFVASAVMGSLWTFTGLVYPSSKGLALGVITTIAYAVVSLAPVLIGYLGDHRSVAFGLWTVCIPAAFLAAFTFLATFLFKPSLNKV